MPLPGFIQHGVGPRIAACGIRHGLGFHHLHTAWQDYDYTTTIDIDRSQLDLLTEDEYNEGDSIAQELRLNASFGDNLDYQLGLYYHEQTTQRGDKGPAIFVGDDFVFIAAQQPGFRGIGFIAQPGDYLQYENVWDTETLAVFGQATWHLGERLRLTGGLRWTDEERDADLFSETISTARFAPAFLSGQDSYFLAPPRTYGATVRYDF